MVLSAERTRLRQPAACARGRRQQDLRAVPDAGPRPDRLRGSQGPSRQVRGQRPVFLAVRRLVHGRSRPRSLQASGRGRPHRHGPLHRGSRHAGHGRRDLRDHRRQDAARPDLDSRRYCLVPERREARRRAVPRQEAQGLGRQRHDSRRHRHRERLPQRCRDHRQQQARQLHGLRRLRPPVSRARRPLLPRGHRPHGQRRTCSRAIRRFEHHRGHGARLLRRRPEAAASHGRRDGSPRDVPGLLQERGRGNRQRQVHLVQGPALCR